MTPTAPPLRQIFYVSRVRAGLRDADIATILAESRRRNHTRDITGALTVTERFFGQFIEGRPDDVARLLASLERDTRHVDPRVCIDRPAALRAFGHWSMGFLYQLDLGDVLQRLYDSPGPAGDADVAAIFRLRPDSMMGAL